MLTETLRRIEHTFSYSRDEYSRISERVDDNYDNNDLEEYFNYLHKDKDSLWELVGNLWDSMTKSTAFQDEIGKVILERNDDIYLKYLKHLFYTQYTFIKDFEEALNMFINKPKESEALISKFNDEDEGKELSKKKFVLGLQLIYIEAFYMAEYVIGQALYQYEPFLKISNRTKENNIKERISVLNTNLKELTSLQIEILYDKLKEECFIGDTDRIVFKRIICQKSIKVSDKIIWTDLSYNKLVNKVTLIDFVSFLTEDKRVQNKFIKNYCLLNSKQERLKGITSESLTQTRKHIGESFKNNERRCKLKKLIDSVIGLKPMSTPTHIP